ncbi:MAG TPA: hypothetical protein VFH51_12385 [Myxococcota bacterium]|nr:hypothetical protein [Myxococcota bacterium]
MLQCPTCGAPHRAPPTCSRCKTDLTLLWEVERASQGLVQRAFLALLAGDPRSAAQAAHRAWALRHSQEAADLLSLLQHLSR